MSDTEGGDVEWSFPPLDLTKNHGVPDTFLFTMGQVWLQAGRIEWTAAQLARHLLLEPGGLRVGTLRGLVRARVDRHGMPPWTTVTHLDLDGWFRRAGGWIERRDAVTHVMVYVSASLDEDGNWQVVGGKTEETMRPMHLRDVRQLVSDGLVLAREGHALSVALTRDGDSRWPRLPAPWPGA